MIPLSTKYEGSVCEIKSEQNDLLVAGIIFRVDAEGMDVVDASGEKMLLIPYGKTVKISIMNNRLGFKMLMGTVYTSTNQILRLVDVESLQNFERRAFFRVNVKMKAFLYPYIEEFNGEIPEGCEPTEIRVENLSLSGLLITTTRMFHLGDAVIIELQIFKDILRLNCRVCRLDVPDGHRNQYGCKYFNITQRQTDKLCGDLFQLQRIELHKRRSIEG